MTDIKIKKLYADSIRLTFETGIRHEIHHIIPLKEDNMNGTHEFENLIILTEVEHKQIHRDKPWLI